MTMQALVIAHAAFGHNHFFKNNYLFRQWTEADGILDYLAFAKRLTSPNARSGTAIEAVESVLDAAHALMNQGVSRYLRRDRANSAGASSERDDERRDARGGDLQRPLAHRAETEARRTPPETSASGASEQRRCSACPRRTCSISSRSTRPSSRTGSASCCASCASSRSTSIRSSRRKMMNEGCATFVHYEIMNRLYERGLLTDGAMLEFLHSHSSRRLPARLRRPALQRHQSLRARLRHDARHQAHLHRADRRGPRMVPRFRRQRRSVWDAAPGLGQLPRRELHPAVS